MRLVRSPFGLKGLYFRLASDRLLFASSLRGVIALEPGGTLNLPWVASFLTLKMEHLAEQSAISEIERVPPAHLIRLDLASGAQARHRFWSPRPPDPHAGWGDDEWISAFHKAFEEAVASALLSPSPIALSVSGGLDSSAIALVAHRLMHDAQCVPPRPVLALSLAMPGWPDTDESAYREAAVARLPRFESGWEPVERAWEWDTVEQWHRGMSMPSAFPNAFMFRSFYEHARSAGSRVKVSGLGGDLVSGAEDYSLLEAWLSLPWQERLAETPFFTRHSVRGYWRLARALQRHVTPRPLRARWQRLRAGPSLITERAHELSAHSPMPAPPRGHSPLGRALYEGVTSPFNLQPFEQRAEILALHGIELRCPFYDRRLIELAFQMPQRLRIRRGSNRYAMKRALAQDLPPLLRDRTSKADFTHFTADSIAPEARARALALPQRLAEAGLIEPTVWHQWATAPEHPTQTITLYRIAHLEQWLACL